jgi:hypothetical protein
MPTLFVKPYVPSPRPHRDLDQNTSPYREESHRTKGGAAGWDFLDSRELLEQNVDGATFFVLSRHLYLEV